MVVKTRRRREEEEVLLRRNLFQLKMTDEKGSPPWGDYLLFQFSPLFSFSYHHSAIPWLVEEIYKVYLPRHSFLVLLLTAPANIKLISFEKPQKLQFSQWRLENLDSLSSYLVLLRMRRFTLDLLPDDAR